MFSRRFPAPRRTSLRLEALEARELLAVEPTAVEQLFLERLNDARANPAAYGQSIGLDLAGVAPSQPLAFNTSLVQAARDHSQDMNDRRFFDHDNPSGQDPGDRLQLNGFPWQGYGESIAAGFRDAASALSGLIIDDGVPDLGHRRHLLAIDNYFRDHTQVGVGIVQNGSGPYRHYYTIDSAVTGDRRPFLSGVVMSDNNVNGVYDVGEGLPGVTVTVAGVGSVTTFGSGGFSIQLSPGTYTVSAFGPGLGAQVVHTITVGATNYRLNITPGSGPSSSIYEAAVQRLYQTVLGRTGSPAEIGPWAVAMENPGGPAFVATNIERSHEARTRVVQGWYANYLGRTAQGGEEQFWVQQLLAGATEEQVLSVILSSQEYYNRARSLFATGTGDAAFVRALFQQFLNRGAGDAEVDNFVRSILPAWGRHGTAWLVLGSAEYRGLQVTSYYTNLLGRSPAQAEVAAWVFSGWDLASIRIGFEASAEFLNRR